MKSRIQRPLCHWEQNKLKFGNSKEVLLVLQLSIERPLPPPLFLLHPPSHDRVSLRCCPNIRSLLVKDEDHIHFSRRSCFFHFPLYVWVRWPTPPKVKGTRRLPQHQEKRKKKTHNLNAFSSAQSSPRWSLCRRTWPDPDQRGYAWPPVVGR